jgi:hypothetical protein
MIIMKEFYLSQVAPILATAIVAILVRVIYKIAPIVIQLLLKLKDEAEQRIIASGHMQDLQTAKEVWDIIEEKFRITENAKEVLDTKANEFDKLLLQRIPGLTQNNIDDLRQAIAGEVNKGKETLTTNITVDQSVDIAALQEKYSNLQAENDNLKSTLNQITQLTSTNIPVNAVQETAEPLQ